MDNVRHSSTSRKPHAAEYDSRPKTTERNFEDDIERMLGEAGWRTFPTNAEAQADYDRELALKKAGHRRGAHPRRARELHLL